MLTASASADPLITDVLVTGSGNATWWTGAEFDHPNLGLDYIVPFLDEDVPAYTDRTHEWNGVSDDESIDAMGLVGAEYVMTANDDKGATGLQMEIELSEMVDAYVFMDTRVTQPQWLVDDGWTFLNRQIGMDEGGDALGPGAGLNNTFWIWKKENVPAGTLETSERGGTGASMYGVAVTVPGVGPGPIEPPACPQSDFQAGNFGVIDIGADGGRPDVGALQDEDGMAQIGAAAHNTNALDLDPRTMISGLGHEFTISLDNLDEEGFPVGGLDWRDRGDKLCSGLDETPLIQLGEDLVKNNAGIIRMTLGDLPAGPYEMTSFHLDPDFDQSDDIVVWVDVGDGFVETDATGNADIAVGGVGGMTPQDVLDTSATFSFTADGENDVIVLFDSRFAADTEVPLNGISIQFGAGIEGDYNADGVLDAADLDLQAAEMKKPVAEQDLAKFDHNGDGVVDLGIAGPNESTWGDRLIWIRKLRGTSVGDVNFDNVFDSGDLVLALGGAKYGSGEMATWVEGDWNGDMAFDSGDLVLAFQDGQYVAAAGPAAVPEPSSALLVMIGLFAFGWYRRRCS